VLGGQQVALNRDPIGGYRLNVQRCENDRVQCAANSPLQVADPAMAVTRQRDVFLDLRPLLSVGPKGSFARRIVEQGRMPGAQHRQGQSRDPRKQKKRSSRTPESAAKHVSANVPGGQAEVKLQPSGWRADLRAPCQS